MKALVATAVLFVSAHAFAYEDIKPNPCFAKAAKQVSDTLHTNNRIHKDDKIFYGEADQDMLTDEMLAMHPLVNYTTVIEGFVAGDDKVMDQAVKAAMAKDWPGSTSHGVLVYIKDNATDGQKVCKILSINVPYAQLRVVTDKGTSAASAAVANH